ncbi:hypothetical protein [Rhodococcus sp. NPDC049939]|uniref:hypothetical protein n=1 Tax=Rhodococcus sp. NPDC049939 TaxID=3155511 RepID=UPI0033EFEF5C
MRFGRTARRAVTAAAALLVFAAPATALAPVANAAEVYPLGTEIRTEASENTVAVTEYAAGQDYTTFRIQYSAGPEGIEGRRLTRPELTYGPSGIPAAADHANSSDPFTGFVAPNTSVTLKWAYKVNFESLSPGTLTAFIEDEEYVWSGDMAGRIADQLFPPRNPLDLIHWGSFGIDWS